MSDTVATEHSPRVERPPYLACLIAAAATVGLMIGAGALGLGLLGMHAGALAVLAFGAVWYFRPISTHRQGAGVAVGSFFGYVGLWLAVSAFVSFTDHT